jgi:hypothetical protein
MNRRQQIVVLCAAILLLILKLILPPFRPWEEGDGAGVFTTGNVVAMMAGVGAIAAVLLVIFSGRK